MRYILTLQINLNKSEANVTTCFCVLKLLELRSANYSTTAALLPENKSKNRNLMYIPCKIDY